jgi:hypothetical protein
MAGALVLPPLMKSSAQTPAGARTPEQIEADMRAIDKELVAVLPSPMLMGDAQFRKEDSAKVIPVFRKMIRLFEEIERIDQESAAAAHTQRLRYSAYSASFGDPEAIKFLEDLAKSNSTDAVAAKSKKVEKSTR